jgi:hypothetical protein
LHSGAAASLAEFETRVQEEVAHIQASDPRDPKTTVGPTVSHKQREGVNTARSGSKRFSNPSRCLAFSDNLRQADRLEVANKLRRV